MRKYFIVLVREDNVWHMENGFYKKEDAIGEKECLRDHYKAKDVKIVATFNKTAMHLEIINKLNGSV